MGPINHVLNSLGDLLMWPFGLQSAWPGLIAFSLATAILLVVMFHLTSNQTAMRRGRDLLIARVLELLLFRHDLRVSLSACWRILVANARYLAAFLVPMAVSVVPLICILGQMASWFEYRPLRAGEAVVVEIGLDRAYPILNSPLKIATSDSLKSDGHGVRIPIENEYCIRLLTLKPDNAWIEIDVGGQQTRRSITIQDNLASISPRQRRPNWWFQLFNPAAPLLAETSPLVRFDVRYPLRQLLIGDRGVHWLLAAFILMMAFSLLLAKLTGVRVA